MSKKPKIETTLTEEPNVSSVEASVKTKEPEKINIEQCEITTPPPKLIGLNEADFTPTAPDLKIKFIKTQANIPICKPSKQNYFRTHRDIEFYLHTLVWEKDGKTYIVTREALPFCAEEVKPFRYFLSIYPQGSIFLYPLPVDSEEDAGSPGKQWHDNDEKVIIEAREKWIKRKADKSIKGYQMTYPEGQIPEPQWPNWTRQEIFDKAFKDFVIKDENHPVIKYLKGLAE